MTLNPDQDLAYQHAIQTLTRQSDNRQIAILGYAGTGKTYTTQCITQRLVDAGYSILAITHTHKALSVLSSALPDGVECATIFSALGWRNDERSGEIRRTGRHKLHGHDAIIVDESSMVDVAMYEELLELTEQAGTPILWVGDPAQLPPINESSCPVFDRVQTQVRLNAIVRQSEGSPIIQASRYLRECIEQNKTPRISDIAGIEGDDRLLIARGGISSIADYLTDARAHGLDARAIAFHRRMEDQIGRIAASRFHPPGSPRMVEGDPITMSARYGDQISNGMEMTVIDRGEMLREHGPLKIDCQCIEARIDGTHKTHSLIVPQNGSAHDSALRRVRQIRDREKRRSRELKDPDDRAKASIAADDAGILAQEITDTYASVRYTYSSTAHKAQGSTYEVAIIHWDDIMSAGSKISAKLLYVACTRPSEYLVIVTK